MVMCIFWRPHIFVDVRCANTNRVCWEKWTKSLAINLYPLFLLCLARSLYLHSVCVGCQCRPPHPWQLSRNITISYTLHFFRFFLALNSSKLNSWNNWLEMRCFYELLCVTEELVSTFESFFFFLSFLCWYAIIVRSFFSLSLQDNFFVNVFGWMCMDKRARERESIFFFFIIFVSSR